MRFKHISAYTSCATVAAGSISGLTGSAVLCGLGSLVSPYIGLTVGWKVTQGKSAIRRVSSAAIGSFISFVAFTTPAVIIYNQVKPSTTVSTGNWRDKFSEGSSKGEEINQPQYKDVKTPTKYTKEQTIDQYVVFLRMLKADGAPSEGWGGLDTRTRAQAMLKAAKFDPSIMENSDRASAWSLVFGQ